MSIKAGKDFAIPFQFIEANLIANTALDLVVPSDGYVEGLQIVVDKAITTGGTLGVTIGASTVVAGLSITVANAATKGTQQSDTPDAKTPTAEFKKGDRIRITPAGFATAGGINGVLHCNKGNRPA